MNRSDALYQKFGFAWQSVFEIETLELAHTYNNLVACLVEGLSPHEKETIERDLHVLASTLRCFETAATVRECEQYGLDPNGGSIPVVLADSEITAYGAVLKPGELSEFCEAQVLSDSPDNSFALKVLSPSNAWPLAKDAFKNGTFSENHIFLAIDELVKSRVRRWSRLANFNGPLTRFSASFTRVTGAGSRFDH